MNTNPQIVAWIADTYSSTKSPATRFTNLRGHPVNRWGRRPEGRDRDTGFGVVATLSVVQAYRKAYRNALHRTGVRKCRLLDLAFPGRGRALLIAVQDASATIYHASRIDPEDLNRHVEGTTGHRRL